MSYNFILYFYYFILNILSTRTHFFDLNEIFKILKIYYPCEKNNIQNI